MTNYGVKLSNIEYYFREFGEFQELDKVNELNNKKQECVELINSSFGEFGELLPDNQKIMFIIHPDYFILKLVTRTRLAEHDYKDFLSDPCLVVGFEPVYYEDPDFLNSCNFIKREII